MDQAEKLCDSICLISQGRAVLEGDLDRFIPGADELDGNNRTIGATLTIQVFKADGVTPANNVLAYVQIVDADGYGYPGGPDCAGGTTFDNCPTLANPGQTQLAFIEPAMRCGLHL